MLNIKRNVLWMAILLVVSTAPPSLARNPGVVKGSMTEAAAARKLEEWRQELTKIESLILQGKSKKASWRGEKLTDEILHRVRSGEGIGAYLGTAYALRAVAAAELGDHQAAIWHWHVGLQLFPELKRFNVSKFGKAGTFLIDHPLGTQAFLGGGGALAALQGDMGSAGQPTSAGVQAPRKIYAPSPVFPVGKLGGGNVSVVVVAMIDTEGIPTHPRIVKADGEMTLVCAALEALRRYRFEPATLNGVPVEVAYNLVVNFKNNPALWR